MIRKEGAARLIGSHELTVSEAMGLHEVLLETANTVEKLAFYADETQNHELETVFHAHERMFERTYQELLGFAQGNSTHQAAFTQPGMSHNSAQGGQKPNRQTIRPEPTGRIEDRTMVMDCLVDCKEMAVASMKVATEASLPSLRRTLADIARQHLDSAFELYKIAEQHGWYPSLKPHESPEEWLRSTHLPLTHQGVSQYSAPYASHDSGRAYTGATAGVGASFQSRGYAQTQSGYGRTAAGATYGDQSPQRGVANFEGQRNGVQYAAPDLNPEQTHRH